MSLRLPALATAHSHAFQRALRGKGQRRMRPDDDFWSWREAMYELAASLTPESIFEISRAAYRELAEQGVRTVGEFHYVHHQAQGDPYEDRNAMAHAVIAAARDAGLRIALLRVFYLSAGGGKPVEGVQRRFADRSLDDGFAAVGDLVKAYGGAKDVRIGVAPHSVRAVSVGQVREIGAFAKRSGCMVHMHVAEQPREVEACLADHGCRVVELLEQTGILSPKFVAVHATHVSDAEIALLARSGSQVCLCPTTERDLGDGLARVTELFGSGIPLSVGIDSHVITNPLEELRLVELDERLRTGKRNVVHREGTTAAQILWDLGSHQSARACGFSDAGGEVEVDTDQAALRGVDPEYWLDALLFGGGHSRSPR